MWKTLFARKRAERVSACTCVYVMVNNRRTACMSVYVRVSLDRHLEVQLETRSDVNHHQF